MDVPRRLLPARFLDLFAGFRLYLLLISLVFVLHGIHFGTYIADDAAISLTYARNFADGYGLVLNPGGERVEGYSNFLWVLLLSLAFKVGLGSLGPVWILKLLGLTFGLATLVVLFLLPKVAYDSKNDDPLRLFGPFVLSFSTSFVLWSVAGLENPLYSFLILLSVYLYLTEIRYPTKWPWSALVLALVAFTRPEGVVYFVVMCVHRALCLIFLKRFPSRKDLIWGSVFVFLYGGFLVWRYNYFGYWVPNTFYAKISANREILKLWNYLVDLNDLGWRYILRYVQKRLLPLVLIFVALAILERKHWIPNLLFMGLLASTILYIIYKGGDYFPEFRLMSPVVPIGILLVERGLNRVRDLLSKDHFAFLLLMVITILVILAPNMKASSNASLVVSMQAVAKRGKWFKEVADLAHIENPKYLEPDIGGTSFFSGLKIVDLGRLADIHLARFQYYPLFFKQYIFDEQRPELVHTHSDWTKLSRITTYPEFWEAYIPIRYYENNYGISGDFIRKDLFVVDDATQLSHPLEVEFGDLRLLGFLPDTPVAFPGQVFSFDWYWQCKPECEQDYSFLLEIWGANQPASITAEYAPVFGWYPTSQWVESEIIRETREIKMPADFTEGSYQVFVGVTDGETKGYQSIGEIIINDELAKRLASENFSEYVDRAEELRWEDALQRIELAAKLDPLNEQYLLAMDDAQHRLQGSLIEKSSLALDNGEYEIAASSLLQAMSIKPLPRNGRAMQKRLSRAFLAQGQYNFEHHKYDEAFNDFKRALEIDPSNVWARHRLEDTRVRLHYVDYYCDTRQFNLLYQTFEDERKAGNLPESPDRIERLYFCLQSVADDATLEFLRTQMDIPDNLDLVLYDVDGSPKLHVLGYRLHHLPGENGTRVTLYFYVLDAIQRDYTIWLHGHVNDTTILPEGRQQYDYANFDHRPMVPTSKWSPGRMHMDSYIIQANPGDYRLSFGFFRPGHKSRLCLEQSDTCSVDLGWHQIR